MLIEFICQACHARHRIDSEEEQHAQPLPGWCENLVQSASIMTCPATTYRVRSEVRLPLVGPAARIHGRTPQNRKKKEESVITVRQPRTIEVVYRNGVTGYVFETPEGPWGVRFCDRPCRGSVFQALPRDLRGMYGSADDAIDAIASHYGTTVRSSAVTTAIC